MLFKKFTLGVLFAVLLFVNSSFVYAAIPDNAKVYYFLHDHLGGIDKVLDDQGNVVESRDYLPFGDDRLQITEEQDNPRNDYAFTGKEKDSETGLYYYGARYYDPVVGRFVSMDPAEGDLTDPQSLNRYSYVLNNPLKYVDPTGMWGVLPGFGGRSHQYITREAIGASNTKFGFLESKLLIHRASIWSDISVYGTGEVKKSYNHSTSSGETMNALQVKEAMMSDAQKWYASENKSDFGRLLHMVEDTYSPAHTERDSDGNIKAFLDYDKQSVLLHMKYDNYKDENGEVRPEALQAINAAAKLIDFYYSDTSWDKVENFLDTNVLKGVNGETTVGKAGAKLEKEEGKE